MSLRPYVANGELLRDALLSPKEMCSMNFAREEFDKLARVLLPMIEPLLYREDEVAMDIARHIEQVRIFSRNFCWRHRHLGASYGVVGNRPGMDEGVDIK